MCGATQLPDIYRKPSTLWSWHMSSTSIALQLRDLFEATCYELFTGLNGQITQVESVDFDGSHMPFAHIDAGCNDFEIEITLSLPFSALAMTYPVYCNITKIDESELEDWITELSNRLMGQLRRNLMMYSVQLQTGVPDHCFGYPSDPKSTQTGYHFLFQFEFDAEVFEAGLFVEVFNPELVFNMRAAEKNAINDGNIEFF